MCCVTESCAFINWWIRFCCVIGKMIRTIITSVLSSIGYFLDVSYDYERIQFLITCTFLLKRPKASRYSGRYVTVEWGKLDMPACPLSQHPDRTFLSNPKLNFESKKDGIGPDCRWPHYLAFYSFICY